jgi:thymidine kinase
MAKVIFRYGAMGSSKTAQVIMAAYNYKERGRKVQIFKPSIEKRDGLEIIKSRCGLEANVIPIDKNTDFYAMFSDCQITGKKWGTLDCIIIDEAQFLSKRNVEDLTQIADDLNVLVICYGLRTDFQGNLFEGSQWLLAWAEAIEEIKTICWCGKKATFNARICDGKIVKDGEQIQLGGNESYISLCREHWKTRNLGLISIENS